jgi:ATP-dependent exoDNAse (exonuclease V) beta subunit
MALIGSVAQKMEHYMEQESMLHISEFNKKIAAFIRKEIVPFVYAKMGDRYRYFFIDEFQDTSRLQWDNVYPLLENSLAESGQVMLVGDGKQSIYRWRGGDVNILFEELAKKDKPISYQVEEIVLPSNWRSSKEIVSFNNALFKSLSSVFQSGAYNYIYDNAAQKIQKGTTGYVEINIAEEKENREERNKADLKRILEDAIHRNLNFKDIAIIARGNKDLKKLTSWLKDWEIPFINNESLLLKNNPSVEFIVHILYAVTFPKKKEYQIFVLEYLYRQKEADNGKFEAWISDYLDKENSTDWISFLQEQGIQFNPALLYQKGFYEWIEELVFIFSIEKDIYINFFLDACLDYIKRHKHNIEGFLNWWEKKKNDLAIKTDASSNAVELLTIHKSKGLEYPVVILPFMDWSRSLKGSEYWFDIGGITEIDIPYMRSSFSKTYTVVPEKVRTQYNSYVDEEIFDMLNMLYVGTTRAVSELYIMAYYKYKSEDYQYVNDLLLYYLEREENWNPEKEQYTLGEKSIRESSIKNEDVFTSYARSEMHWRGKIKIARQAPELWDLENFTSESDWGNLLHDTMADIEDRGDMEKAIRRQTNKRWLSTEEVEKLKASVKGILEHPDLKQYFDSPQEVYNEQDICIRNGNILRPDRLVKCKDGTWALLDYKTGAPFSDHRRQIEEYALLLRNMGYEGLEKILVYTANLKIEKWK